MKEYAIAALTGLLANTELVNTKEEVDKKHLAQIAWDIAEEMEYEAFNRNQDGRKKDRAYSHSG